MRVLAADSDDLFLEILQTYLRRRGIEIETAEGTAECMDRLRLDPPNLLILSEDLAWGQNGVAARVRDNRVLREMPVILLTHHHEDRDDGALRVEGRLRKPFRLSDLVSLIRSVEFPPLPIELRLELADRLN